MNKQTGAVIVVFAGVVFVIMSVRGSWENVWAALTGKKVNPNKASALASYTFGPGGVSISGGSGTGRPGSAPAPLAPRAPGGGGYSALMQGGQFAGVDQGIDFTGPGRVYALASGVITRLMRSGSGWPGEGALLVERFDSGQSMYVAEDFAPASGLRVGSRVGRGQLLGTATGSGRAPGIEAGWSDPSGRPLDPLYPNPHSPKPHGYDFQRFVQSLSGGSVQGSGVLA